MAMPSKAKYVIIGAGIHGLSTAWHLAEQLEAKGQGSGADVLVLDKTGIAAGASGIACGVVRNNYFQPAMRELMAHSVEVWESDMEAFSYHPVGYMQISPEVMHEDVASIYRSQKAIGYESEFIEGEEDCMTYMQGIFHDWQAKGITSVLHEKKGGFANNTKAIYGLAGKAEAKGVRIMTGVTVTGFQQGHNSNAVTAVETDKGVIECEQVVVGVGPWVNSIWNMLELPKSVSIKGADGAMHEGIPTWRYWCLEEGVLGVDPNYQLTNDGQLPPVIHVDNDLPLYSDVDGSLITEEMWGIYYKPDFHFGGVQGGAACPTRSRARRTPLLSTPTASTRRSSSSTITSPICGPRPWPFAKSGFEGQGWPLQKRALRRAGLLSHRIPSRSLTASARTSTSSQTPTTATR